MQITINENLEKRINALPNPNKFVQATLEKALTEKVKRQQQLEKAVELAMKDYQNDPELTAFTSMDGDEFYDYEKK